MISEYVVSLLTAGGWLLGKLLVVPFGNLMVDVILSGVVVDKFKIYVYIYGRGKRCT